MRAIIMVVALSQAPLLWDGQTLVCTEWQQITTCLGPGGYVSHEWDRDGMRFGDDNQGDRWTVSYAGRASTRPRSSRRQVADRINTTGKPPIAARVVFIALGKRR